MTEGAICWTLQRREYQLGQHIMGGEDGIYRLPRPRQLVARMHDDGSDLSVRERRVNAMLDRQPELPDIVEHDASYVRIAWPEAALRNKLGLFVGYTMPAIDIETTSQLEYVLQERQARAENLPTGLGAKIALAANLAVAITELHEKGHRVVYLTPANLRFHRQSLYVAMHDCEHFSVQGDNERFAADADAAGRNASHYLAPEFQNQPILPEGEESQDCFALAVVVFQLLNFGIHPFTGKPVHEHVPTDIPGRIAGHCYPYGSIPNTDLEPSPGSGHQAMPEELKSLFDRAFAGQPGERPSAQEWATWLQIYSIPSNNWLVVCRANTGHHHFVDLPCAACARTNLLLSSANAADIALEGNPDDPLESTTRPFAPPEPVFKLEDQPYLENPPEERVRRLPASLVVALQIVAVLALVAFGVREVGAYLESQKPKPTRVHRFIPEPADAPAVPAPDPDLVGFPAMEKEEALTDGYVRTAARAIAIGDRGGWDKAIATLRTSAPAHAAPAPSGYQAAFTSFTTSLSPESFNERQRQVLLNELRQVLRQNPYDDESAFELGWLSLAGGEHDEARSFFLHAVWANPDRADAWYGLGVVGAGENQMIGALATAEILTTDATLADTMRNAFPPLLLRLCAIKPDYFAGLQTRARHIADQNRPVVTAPVIASPASGAASPQ